MSEDHTADSGPSKHGGVFGKAREIAGAILHSDELVEDGQLEEDAADGGHRDRAVPDSTPDTPDSTPDRTPGEG